MDITDFEFIKDCCYKYLKGKRNRNDVAHMFAKSEGISFERSKFLLKFNDSKQIDKMVSKIAKEIQMTLITKELNLPPIKYRDHVDVMTKKERVIGIQKPIHQIYDYIAVYGMMEVLKKKIGVFQCASIPKRGQSYGKKHIERWVKNSKKQLYFVKGDIKKCFPSISHDLLKKQLRKDIKNDDLIWLLDYLIDMFGNGLSIGSYLSQYLSNYHLSQSYHYISNDLYKIRNGKRIRSIEHVLFYMDDFILIGHSKRELKKSMFKVVSHMKSVLGLEIKPWKICKFSDNEPIDMMGFVFRKNKTTIRDKIFLKARQYYLQAFKNLKNIGTIPANLAHKCISAYGWFKLSDSYKIKLKHNIDYLHEQCKETISRKARIKDEQHYRKYQKIIISEYLPT
jgi:RNA-directed DNA polymerase